MTDLVVWNEVNIEYRPTDEMIADYVKKPLVGEKLQLLRDMIMNINDEHHRIG